MHREHEARTGACAVVVVGKERTLCASLAACQKYPTSHLVENWVRDNYLIAFSRTSRPQKFFTQLGSSSLATMRR